MSVAVLEMGEDKRGVGDIADLLVPVSCHADISQCRAGW
jgi:hypothetical protein